MHISVLTSLFSPGYQTFFLLTASGLPDLPARHHELPPPAPVGQQLCGQPPQRLHDGYAEADPSRSIHFLACLPSHRKAAATKHPESEPGLRHCLRFHFKPRELPQLLLQCGEKCSDGPERCCRCTRQVSSNGC